MLQGTLASVRLGRKGAVVITVALLSFPACSRPEQQSAARPTSPEALRPVGDWKEVQAGEWEGVRWRQFVAPTASGGGICHSVEFEPLPYEDTPLSAGDAAAVHRQLESFLYKGKNPYCRSTSGGSGNPAQVLGGYQALGSKFFYLFGTVHDRVSVDIQFNNGDSEQAIAANGAFMALYRPDRRLTRLTLNRADGESATCTINWDNPRVPFSSEC